MRERQIFATEVKIKARSENGHAHGRTLDVPTRATFAPRTVPEDNPIAGNPSLPQCEIGQVVLVVGVARDAFGAPLRLRIQRHQLSIATTAGPVLVDTEVHRAIARSVSNASLLQPLDKVDDLRNVIGCLGQMMGPEARKGGQIREKGLGVLAGKLGQRLSRGRHLADNLVLHVRDIHHVVDAKSPKFEVAPQEICKDEGPKVSDVTEVVHSGSAAIEPNGFGVGKQWRECLHPTVERVEQAQGHAMDAEPTVLAQNRKASYGWRFEPEVVREFRRRPSNTPLAGNLVGAPLAPYPEA